jgi:membrane protein
LAERVARPPKFSLKILIQLFSETGNSWVHHKAPRMGAALAYYSAFSLAPLLVLIFSIFSLIYKQRSEAVDGITKQLEQVLPQQAGDMVQGILDHAASTRGASGATVISLVILLFSASSAFGEMQDALNQIWDVPAEKQALLAMIKQRALSFSMVFVLGFLMMASLAMSAIITALSRLLVIKFPAVGLELSNNAISMVLFTALFAAIYRILPNVPLRWRDVLPGAFLSTVLFMIGKLLLAWYIGKSSTFSAYGAAGSFAIILLWVYYSAQILYLGAEFTRVYTKRYGSHRDA